MSRWDQRMHIYFTPQRNVTILSSFSVALLFFFILIVPPLTRLHFVHKECIVVESTIVPKYCCKKICSYCDESNRQTPICASLIQRTHLERNITQCLLGEKKFCADEGAYCQKGYKCCEETPYYYDPTDLSKFYMICTRWVNNLSCRLHCPTCWKSRIVYAYEKICKDGACRNMTFIKEHECSTDKIQAEKEISFEPVNSRKDCWVNPDDSQDIHFSRDLQWWRIFLVCISAAPGLVVLLCALLEILIDASVDWTFPRFSDLPQSNRRFGNRANRMGNDDEEQLLRQNENDPPPSYSEF